MKKDVIYIDIEDDITTVIDKVVSSKEKIIALVPPKGSAVLQSVVNLKLLHRAAAKVEKRPVIVTSNASLTALAGGVGIYIAKTLQSKPEIPSGEDFDEVTDQPVELSDDVGSITTHTSDDPDDEVELTSDDIDLIEKDDQPASGKPTKTAAKKPNNKKKKVPNFGSFRKKAILIGGGVLLLLILLITIFGRTKADIVMRAGTNPIDVQLDVAVSVAAETSAAQKTLKAQKQETKKNVNQEFTATGEKDVGEKAKGDVTLSSDSFGALLGGIDIPAGTALTSSGGSKFTTDTSVRLTATPGGNSKTVGITAEKNGKDFNGASGSMSGAPDTVSATIQGSTSGGTDKKIKVVSQADIDKARASLDKSQDDAAIKKELEGAFSGKVKVLDDSFTKKIANVRSEPAVGQEASNARITATITYSMLAVSEDELGGILDEAIMADVPNKDQQRVYKNGIEEVQFQKKSGSGDRIVYQIGAVGRYGPRFDTEDLKNKITGKKAGEVRSILQDLPGVSGVDINLSPFWARSMPGVEKIEIKLDVDESAN